MNLSTGEMAVVFGLCASLIGVVFVLYRRGVFGKAKVEETTAVGSAK